MLLTEEEQMKKHMEFASKSSIARFYWTHVRKHAVEFVTSAILIFNVTSAPNREGC